MNQKPRPVLRSMWLLLLALLMLLGACDSSGSAPSADNSGSSVGIVNKPANAIEINIIYAPESEAYLPQAIYDFNNSYANGINPVTGQRLASGERPIYVVGENGSSGTVMQGIVNAIIAPNNQNVERPTIFAPSVSHWLALANYQSNRPLFDLSASRATALAPVVMAIWESRLQAIRDTVGYQDVGWEELLMVLNSPNGWADFGISGRRTVYYGHTDPNVSSTGLSTLIAEFYAAARANGFQDRVLTMAQINDPAVQQGVRDIEQLIRHYSRRTTEFKEYIAQGPEYLDFVALEENDLIYINQGKTQYQPPERLVALYPKEGTFWHEHPFGIVNAPWVTAEQAAAAVVFTDYVLTEAVQKNIVSNGFRPANPNVPLDFPFVPENGVTLEGPITVLDVPAPAVVASIQRSWAVVKKQADIVILIDTSGSMLEDDKIGQAKTAALAFLDAIESNNRVALSTFSDTVNLNVVPLNNYENNQTQLRQRISSLQAGGGTELYQALTTVINDLNESDAEDRIRAVLLLSDGADTGSAGITFNQAIAAIEASRNSLNPVIVIPIAYGDNADVSTLSAIGRASQTKVQSGDVDTITQLLELLSSYF
jgi:Ca-activated chloride channel homolog